jgi:hypothetical protein
MMIDSTYKDQQGDIWICKARGMSLNKERFALLVNKKGVVWFTTEPDWKIFEELKRNSSNKK